jgi:glycosyltransferase involved in cell wall biosynthesis
MAPLGTIIDWIESRYRVRLLRRAAGRCLEILKYSVVRPAIDRRFHLVSAQRNAGEAAIACLQSVFDQRYPRELVRHIFIDDASTDETPELIEAWLEDHPEHCVEFIRNRNRTGMLANNIEGFALAAPDDIGVELNGDDWLPDPGVLTFLNKVYADDDVWLTYNTLRRSDGTILFTVPPSRSLKQSARYRGASWMTSHLHTFRALLYQMIPEDALVDPTTGSYWAMAQDIAVYLAMLEMAGHRARHLYRITAAYNLHESSDEIRDRGEQLELTRRIRARATYPALESLP